jgi:hypothetical protein
MSAFDRLSNVDVGAEANAIAIAIAIAYWGRYMLNRCSSPTEK